MNGILDLVDYISGELWQWIRKEIAKSLMVMIVLISSDCDPVIKQL